MMYVPDTAIDGLSRTALGVVAYCALVNRNPAFRGIYYDPFAERLFAEAAVGGQDLLARLPDWPAVLDFADDVGMSRRLLTSPLWRKTFVQRGVLDALDRGAQQVVILGSGLDTLALRLSALRGDVPVYEVDRPETIAAKAALVTRNFGDPPNVRYTAVDFAREATLDRLQALGYDHARPTVFIAEVSLEYVPPEEVAKVYAMIRSNGSPLTRFLTTYASTAQVSADQGERDGIGQSVAGAGEPFRFHVLPEEVAPYVSDRGFVLERHLYHRERMAGYLDEIGLDPALLPFGMEHFDRSSFSLAALRPA